MYMAKLDSIADILKNCLHISKTVRSVQLFQTIFDRLRNKKYSKTYVVATFCKPRWSTINHMLKQILRVKRFLRLVSLCIENEVDEQNTDSAFEIPDVYLDVFNCIDVWGNIEITKNDECGLYVNWHT